MNLVDKEAYDLKIEELKLQNKKLQIQLKQEKEKFRIQKQKLIDYKNSIKDTLQYIQCSFADIRTREHDIRTKEISLGSVEKLSRRWIKDFAITFLPARNLTVIDGVNHVTLTQDEFNIIRSFIAHYLRITDKDLINVAEVDRRFLAELRDLVTSKSAEVV